MLNFSQTQRSGPVPTVAFRPNAREQIVDVVTNQPELPLDTGLEDTLINIAFMNREYTDIEQSGPSLFKTIFSEAMRDAKQDARLSYLDYVGEREESEQEKRRADSKWWSVISKENPTQVQMWRETAGELPVRGPGATWTVCSVDAEKWDPLTNADLRSTKLPEHKHKLLFYQDPETGKVEGRSTIAVDASVLKNLTESFATLNGLDTTPTERKRVFYQSLSRSRSELPFAWGCSQVEDKGDWAVIKRRKSEYFPILSGPDLTTIHWKRQMAYEGDPPILSIFAVQDKSDDEGEGHFEVLTNQDIPVGSAIANVVQTCKRLNLERPEDFVGQLQDVLELATTADDEFVNETSILCERNPNRQKKRRACSHFFPALSSEHPYQVSLTRNQATELRSTAKSQAARAPRGQSEA